MTANLQDDEDHLAQMSEDTAQGNSSVARQLFSRSLDNYPWQIALDHLRGFWLNWKSDYKANRIDFALSIDTELSGFEVGKDVLALGFSERGQLEDADYCLAWYDLSQRLHLQDVRTDSKSKLEFMTDEVGSRCRLIPEQANSHLSSHQRHTDRTRDLHEAKEMLTIAFSRPLDVCDESDQSEKASNRYYHIDNGTTHLVWFTIPGPLLEFDGQNLSALLSSTDSPNRLARGSREPKWGLNRVQLVGMAEQTQLSNEEHRQSLELRMDKYQVPAQETTYLCKLFKLPKKFHQRRFHVISFGAVIETGNEHIVHHMELFNCAPRDQEEAASLDRLYRSGGWQGDCNGPERPAESQLCKRVILAWAMGAKPLVYPKQAGQPIGGPGYNPYVVLEVHYNNQLSSAGLTDSSGLKFDYTRHLRQYDAGILEVGLEYTDKNSMPPGLLAPLVGFCTGQCTRTALATSGQPNGIFVFAGQMHTHLTGVASWTELVREGRLVGELQRDDHYSPHFQEIRLLAEPVRVEPGDTLAHYCLYDTRKRANITLGGFATTDEMCVTYLHYYPRVDLEVCKSSVGSRALESYFAYLARLENQATSERLLELAKINDRQNGGSRSANVWPGDRGPEAGGARDEPAIKLSWPGASLGRDNDPLRRQAKSVADNYRSVDWSTRRSLELLEFYANAPLSVQCNRSDGRRLPGNWEAMQPPKVLLEPGQRIMAVRLAEAPESPLLGAAGLAPPFAGAQQLAVAGGAQLAAYRGAGFRRRHAQCEARLQIVGQDR